MQGLALMRGLTGNEKSFGYSGNNETGNLLRQHLMAYIQTASDLEILKLNVLVAQIADSARWPQSEAKQIEQTVNS